MGGMTHAVLNHNVLAENFSFLGDWEDRYAYLIDLGKNLPVFPDGQKNDDTFVRGCTSQVWMINTTENQDVISFLADSDAHIVRGLIAVLYAVYQQQTKDFVRTFPIDEYFTRLGLQEHLSPNRRNGFFAMVKRIQDMAA